MTTGKSTTTLATTFHTADNHALVGIRYLHGCNVLYELVQPWANTGAIVVADSYFASVQAALRLREIGLHFIGTIKEEIDMVLLQEMKLHPLIYLLLFGPTEIADTSFPQPLLWLKRLRASASAGSKLIDTQCLSRAQGSRHYSCRLFSSCARLHFFYYLE